MIAGGLVETTLDLPPFDDVYRGNADAVFRFCLSQLRDPHAAEDVCADVFAAALAAYARRRPSGDGVRPWLFAIARNATVDHHRRAHRGLRLLDRIRRNGTGHGDVESDAVVRSDLRQAVAAIAALRPRDRQLVGLRIAGQLSFTEIGDVMGMSEHAATVATHRALQRLRTRLEEADHD